MAMGFALRSVRGRRPTTPKLHRAWTMGIGYLSMTHVWAITVSVLYSTVRTQLIALRHASRMTFLAISDLA